MNEILEEYIKKINAPTGKNSSVYYGSDVRFKKACEQAEMKPVKVDVIIKVINEFLERIGMEKIDNPIVEKECLERLLNGDYGFITEKYTLKDKRDIVWLKFTKDGYVGVVAASSDINFKYPKSEEDYTKEKCNTSGIIVHSLDKEWDKEFVLVFPLINIPEGYKRGNIETAIGNVLVEKGIPILDYYSHIY